MDMANMAEDLDELVLQLTEPFGGQPDGVGLIEAGGGGADENDGGQDRQKQRQTRRSHVLRNDCVLLLR